MYEGEVVGWITVRGNHIPIYNGDSKMDALARFIKTKQAIKRSNKEYEINKKYDEKQKELVKKYDNFYGISDRDASDRAYRRIERARERALDNSKQKLSGWLVRPTTVQNENGKKLSVEQKRKWIQKNLEIANREYSKAEAAGNKKNMQQYKGWQKAYKDMLNESYRKEGVKTLSSKVYKTTWDREKQGKIAQMKDIEKWVRNSAAPNVLKDYAKKNSMSGFAYDHYTNAEKQYIRKLAREELKRRGVK